MKITDHWILSQRGDKNAVDFQKPYAYLVEKERVASGEIEEIATIFLTNRECPFRCLMCDLWKNTTDKAIPTGAIPYQIKQALDALPPTKHIKLYNSGSFFDRKAIPEADYLAIAELLCDFEHVIVECHPKMINEQVLKFRDMLKPSLEIAIGLETVHPEILQKLNKRMDLVDFEKAVKFLSQNDISSRAFILLKPPFSSESEGICWAKKSIDFAFEIGVGCCIIIPTRVGNGAMEWLAENGYFSQPHIFSLEDVLEYGIQKGSGRVFADLWDVELFSSCSLCVQKRKNRMQEMNLFQTSFPAIQCECER